MSALRIEEITWADGGKGAKWIDQDGQTVAEVRVKRVLQSLIRPDEARYDVEITTNAYDPADPPPEDGGMYRAHKMDATTRRPT